jgi:hypothetical protein
VFKHQDDHKRNKVYADKKILAQHNRKAKIKAPTIVGAFAI